MQNIPMNSEMQNTATIASKKVIWQLKWRFTSIQNIPMNSEMQKRVTSRSIFLVTSSHWRENLSALSIMFYIPWRPKKWAASPPFWYWNCCIALRWSECDNFQRHDKMFSSKNDLMWSLSTMARQMLLQPTIWNELFVTGFSRRYFRKCPFLNQASEGQRDNFDQNIRLISWYQDLRFSKYVRLL